MWPEIPSQTMVFLKTLSFLWRSPYTSFSAWFYAAWSVSSVIFLSFFFFFWQSWQLQLPAYLLDPQRELLDCSEWMNREGEMKSASTLAIHSIQQRDHTFTTLCCCHISSWDGPTHPPLASQMTHVWGRGSHRFGSLWLSTYATWVWQLHAVLLEMMFSQKPDHKAKHATQTG